jgi:hypothetical protein
MTKQQADNLKVGDRVTCKPYLKYKSFNPNDNYECIVTAINMYHGPSGDDSKRCVHFIIPKENNRLGWDTYDTLLFETWEMTNEEEEML